MECFIFHMIKSDNCIAIDLYVKSTWKRDDPSNPKSKTVKLQKIKLYNVQYKKTIVPLNKQEL